MDEESIRDALASITCVTPLYHFGSDTAALDIDDGISIRSIEESYGIDVDEHFARHLHIFQPDYLLWDQSRFHGEIFGQELSLLTNAEKVVEDIPRSLQRLVERLTTPTVELLRLLSLFKPGRIRAGETFILWKPPTAVDKWAAIASTRASGMIVDYSVLVTKTTSYVLNFADISLFHTFRAMVDPILAKLRPFPALEAAIEIYGAENGDKVDTVGAVSALEGLLSTESDSEGLAYRLALRIANLLGQTPAQRKAIFRQVKEFYKLRSKIVHGTVLKPKHLDSLKDLDLLRDVLRKVLLCAMALVASGIDVRELPDLLDELAFDDEKRNQLQATTSRFVSLGDRRADSAVN